MNDAHTYLGSALTGYGPEPIWLSEHERFSHTIAIGASGTGKSSLLRAIAGADAARGDGLLYLDSHGDDFELLLDRIPPWRHDHVALVDLSDLEFPVAINALEVAHPDDRARIADTLVTALHDIWIDAWGPRLEMLLRHSALALLHVRGSTIAQIAPLLTNDAFRQRVIARVTNPLTRNFFTDRFEEWRSAFKSEAIEPVLTRLDSVLSFPAILHTLGQHRHTLSLEDAMQGRRIILVNLGRGTVGETGANLMGALLLARARTAAMSRARIAPEQRAAFHIVADEFATYGGNISAALAELRKFACSFTGATQLLSTLPERTREAILGTATTIAAFRCSPKDGDAVAGKFNDPHREFNPSFFNELGTGEAMVKIGSRDVRRLRTPPPEPGVGTKDVVRRQARRHYARPRAEVEPWIHETLRRQSGSATG
jgi:hypothetical protein